MAWKAERRRFTQESRIPVRAAAARALRLAEAPEVASLLAGAITDDSDSQVRAAATFATSFRRRNGPLVDARMQAASTFAVMPSRNSVRHPQGSSDIPETLAWVAEHDPKPRLSAPRPREPSLHLLTGLPARLVDEAVPGDRSA